MSQCIDIIILCSLVTNAKSLFSWPTGKLSNCSMFNDRNGECKGYLK